MTDEVTIPVETELQAEAQVEQPSEVAPSSLLGDVIAGIGADDKAEEAPQEDKPEDVAPEPEAATTEASVEEESGEEEGGPEEAEPKEPEPLAAVEYDYTLPETLTLPDERKAEFHAALDAFRADPSKGVQGLIDMHNRAMEEHVERARQEQFKVWNETNDSWRKQVLADPEIGGAGHQTAMMAIARMRDRLASSHKPGTPEYVSDLAAFDQFLNVTGAGNHPVFLKLLHNSARLFDEPAPPPPNPKPPKDIGKQNGKGLLYDHPRSVR